jgi:syntaxin-binding protein 1
MCSRMLLVSRLRYIRVGATKQNTAGLTFPPLLGTDAGWKILIVDDTSMRVLSAAVGMYDIMERKITIVESLEKKRAPFKDMGAIYILAPTKDSVKLLLEDFADKTKVLYGPNIFVFFLGPIPPQLLSLIKQCKQLVKRLKALSEINLDFLVKEQRAFTFDLSIPFSGYFLRSGSGPAEVPLADKMVSICATLNEYPYIRYRQTSGICSSIATLFKMKMDEFVSSNPTWWYHGSGKSGNTNQERERSTLLLLDRASDCLTPLMHDFTYQSMVHDLLKIEGDKITYGAESAEDPSKTEDKDVLLNEKDALWVELRGKHIAQVIEILSGRIKEICKSSTSSAFSGGGEGGNMSLSQLASALKALPEYREVMSKLSQHMHISHECMDEFNKQNLMDLSDIEQTLATGKDEDGRSPKLTEMISRTEGALLRMSDVKDRLRLVLVATISQNGLSSADRDRLLRAAQLGRQELLVVDSLSKLGIQTLNNTAGGSSSGGAMGFFR